MLARRAGMASAVAVVTLVVTALGFEAGRVAALKSECRDAELEAAALADRWTRQAREEEAVDRLAGRLIDGAEPLSAGVDQMQPVLRARVGFEHEWRADPPPTFRHRVGRYLVNRVTRLLDRDPDRREVVLARLTGEYAALR